MTRTRIHSCPPFDTRRPTAVSSSLGDESGGEQKADGRLPVLDLPLLYHFEGAAELDVLDRQELVGFRGRLAVAEPGGHEDVNHLVGEPRRGEHRVQMLHRVCRATRFLAQLASRAIDWLL